MQTCDTCKHWKKDKYGMGVDSGQCENPKNQENNNHFVREPGETDCMPFDASSYGAGLDTMPKFGCVNHEN